MSILSKRFIGWALCIGTGIGLVTSPSAAVSAVSLEQSGYVSDQSVTAFNYSPTIVQTTEGLLVAWVSGSGIDSPDASVYLSRNDGGVWTQPEKIQSNIDSKTLIQTACRRPVLFKPTNESLMLFYKSENSRRQLKGMLSTSSNNGRTWLRPKTLPRSVYGPARTKPIELSDGALLCGCDTHDAGWVVHVERASAFRRKWEWSRTRDLSTAIFHNASEPVLLNHEGGNIQALSRTKRGYIVESWSDDSGETWEQFERTALPNPDGGLDVVKMGPQDFVMVYQHSNRERGVLNLAKTRNGKGWAAAAVLENQPGRSFSDPAMVKGADGNLHLVYTEDQKRIKYVRINPAFLAPIPMVGGNWPY